MPDSQILKELSVDDLLQELRAREAKAKNIPLAIPLEPSENLREFDDASIVEVLKENQKVIYGIDDRVDIFQLPTGLDLDDVDSVVALFEGGDVVDNGNSTSTLQTQNFGAARNLCVGERFRDQPVGAFCSGFLVAPDIIATAGHCVNANNVANIRFVFGFRMRNATTAETIINNAEVYRGIAIIDRQEVGNGPDWALVRIDRPVTNHRIARIRWAGRIGNGQAVHVIGHPSGLPTKFAGGATVRDNQPNAFFVANLDTYGGNSGSPVFNSNTHEVEGILVRGEADFVQQGNCTVSLVCPATGCRGEDCTRTTEFAHLVEVMAPVPVNRAAPAVASWGRDRIDIFGRGLDNAAFHKAWAQDWHPSPVAWEPIGGGFINSLAVESWGPDRLDVFGIGLDNAMWHKAWAQGWFPSQESWEPIGGGFTSPPTVASWGPDRLDIFALGLDQAVWHKAWAQGWFPSQDGWEPIGGKFISQPTVCSWGPGRLDIFGVGLDKAMFHKAWANGWHPSPASWEFLGGGFTSPPAVCSWGPERLDIFALGLDGSMWHKAWAQGWFPSQESWEPLGGKFLSPPAVASWGPGRIDIFGVGLDGAIYHKAWDNGWSPPPGGWEYLGGVFSSPPAVVSWGPERLDIFALGKDFGVWHKAWAQGWFPSQDSWEPIGGGFL